MPDNALFSSTPARGSWLGFFSGNPSKTNIVNTYNSDDDVLNVTLTLSENTQKPFVGFLGFSSDQDDTTAQFWASLLNTDGGQESLWDAPCSSMDTCQHSNIIREWAELAFWFPFRSHAVGTYPLGVLPSGNNLSLTSYAPPPAGNVVPAIWDTPAHSYLKDSPYPSVFPAWQQIAAALK